MAGNDVNKEQRCGRFGTSGRKAKARMEEHLNEKL
jgi:hypothetical protein